MYRMQNKYSLEKQMKLYHLKDTRELTREDLNSLCLKIISNYIGSSQALTFIQNSKILHIVHMFSDRRKVMLLTRRNFSSYRTKLFFDLCYQAQTNFFCLLLTYIESQDHC